jgi:hypothetical protein
MDGLPLTIIALSRGRAIRLEGPHFYQDLLTALSEEILLELAELERLDLKALGADAFEQVVGITQIRLLNELYFCLGQLKAKGVDLDIKQAIQDLRDIWNRMIDQTRRPEVLKLHEEPGSAPVQ